jgi:hypothetical protein
LQKAWWSPAGAFKALLQFIQPTIEDNEKKSIEDSNFPPN